MPNSISNVSFSPYAAEQGDIERKRALAQALQQQSMQPIENAPSGGWAVPISPWQGLAKMAQAGTAAYGQRKIAEQQADLGKRYQDDYRSMVARGLKQLQGSPATAVSEDASGNVSPAQAATPGDPQAALATFAEHPMGQAMMPMAMQDLHRQQLIAALRGPSGGQPAAAPAPQGNPMAQGGASVMAPGGGAPQAPQQPQPAPGPQMGGPAGGIPLETWLQVDPTGGKYLQHLAQQGESSGRVYHDQNRKAFTLNKNGQRIDIPGTEAMVKPEAVNLGGSTQFVNPFKQTEPLAHSLTPMQGIEAPIHLGRYQFETGQTPPALPGAAGATPGPQPAPGGQPVALPGPQPRPALPGGSGPLTPQAAAKLAAERAEKMPSARQATELQGQDLDRLSKLAVELRDHPGIVGSTGILGAAPSVPGNSAAQAEALTTSLKAQVAGMKLQAMRNASKTGGAVGQVTEKEWPRLENMITALDPVKMGQETFQRKLEELVGEISKVKKSVNDSFKNEYGQEIGKGELSPAEKIELEALRKEHGR